MVWLVRDNCGIACVLLAWLLMAYSQYTLLTIILLPKLQDHSTDFKLKVKYYIHIFTFEFFSFLMLASHLRTILTDPGSVPRKTATPEVIQIITSTGQPNQVVYKCSECCSVKPDRAHHCSVCQRCIRKMDHHCPWVNNCVGERNQKFFVLFTLYVTIISAHALCLAISYFLDCLWSEAESLCFVANRGGRQSPEQLIMLVFLIFEALLFALFGAIMLFIQIMAIWSDYTGIENLKQESRDRRSGCVSIRRVFGDRFIHWFSPFTQAQTNDYPPCCESPSKRTSDCPV